MKKYFYYLIIFLLPFSSFLRPQELNTKNISTSKQILVGEDLLYVVKYLGFAIGEVRLKITDKKIVGTDTIYSSIAHINSYRGLPFVNLHQIYESKFNQHEIPVFFRGTVFGDDSTFTDYTFKKNNLVHVKRGKLNSSEIWVDSTGYLKNNHQDGLSLFYFARMRTGQDTTYNVPCFVNEKSEKTVINYYPKNVDISIDAVDYDIDCVMLDGHTEFISLFGLTGNFEGWFSNDNRAIPIIAKMHVIIGSIKLELIEWNKKEWMPPKFIKKKKK